MNTTINTKELCKYIRKNKGRYWIWQRQENQHFITDRMFLVRFKEVPNDVLATLFGVFFKVPEVGETLISHDGISMDQAVNFDKIYKPNHSIVEGVVTPYMREIGHKGLARIIKFHSHHSVVNEEYFRFSVNTHTKTVDKPLEPIYMANGDLMILPYRTANDDRKLLNEIMEVEV